MVTWVEESTVEMVRWRHWVDVWDVDAMPMLSPASQPEVLATVMTVPEETSAVRRVLTVALLYP
jgi:hypothetical protein